MPSSPPELTKDQISALLPGVTDVSKIGEGGFKTVFRAKSPVGWEVIKVVAIPRADGSEDQDRYRDECLQRVRREVNVLAQCQTPYMVKLGSLPLVGHEVGDDYYVIYSEELLPGPDLRDIIIGRGSPPDEREVKLLMRCLLLAIKELWSRRYIHRDIKPANVISLNDASRPFVLIDLGIAFGLLETGITVGSAPCTLRYFAPEMANPGFRASLDYRSDLYTTALTVFEFASGEHPIARSGDDKIRTVSRALHTTPRHLSDIRSDLSRSFCNLIDQLLKKKPSLRPANLDYLINQTNS